MTRILLEASFILLLLVANGLFAMSEIAVVSARRSRLDHLARNGDRRARAALALADNPNNFLATVQIGITLVGILAGVFGGATIAREFGDYLNAVPGLAPRGEEIALPVVVLVITYLSLVIGELVPKRIALANPERIASRIALFMTTLARIARPAVWLLSKSSDVVGALIRIAPAQTSVVTDEEVTSIVASGARAGAFHPDEAAMVRRVFSLGDRRASAVMTPRPEIVWLDLTQPSDVLTRTIIDSGYSRFPAAEGSLDDIVGVIDLRSVAAQSLSGKPIDLRGLIQPPVIVPEHAPALAVLERFRHERQQFAFVVDEYGGVEGIVTISDLAESVVGTRDVDAIVTRRDGSMLVDAMINYEDLAQTLDLRGVKEGDYDTLAGFVLAQMSRLPRVGDTFDAGGYHFEVVDMDGNRVDRVLITKRQVTADEPDRRP